MEEQQGRMMLYPQQNYGMGGMGGEESLATSPAPTQGDESQQQRQHADINTILDQVHSFDLDTIFGNKDLRSCMVSIFLQGVDQEILPSGQGRIDIVNINPSLLTMRERQIPNIPPISILSDHGRDRPIFGRGPEAHSELPQNETSSFLGALRDQREDSHQHKKLQRRRSP